MEPIRALPVRRRTLVAAAGTALAAVTGSPGRAGAAPRRAAGGAAPSPRQLAGRRVVYSYPGLTPPDSLLAAIGDGAVAGVIFFGENIASGDQIASVADQLAAAHARGPGGPPLLLMTDQEGGLVRRLPGAPQRSQKQIGESAQAETEAIDAGRGAADTLRAAGMNMNLAPVLDVYREPGDFADRHQRSYSSDPGVCASLGGVFVHAQQSGGVAACAKHFPGLGAAAADQNTDEGPVTLGQGLSELRRVDEAPYRAAISSGVAAVMVSWAVYPALDAANPAGLSAAVVRRELRSHLGFTGVTVTDALEAGALPASLSAGERAVAAAAAGMDLLLCSARDPAQGDAAVTALADAYRDGRLPAADFRAAERRVAALRAAW